MTPGNASDTRAQPTLDMLAVAALAVLLLLHLLRALLYAPGGPGVEDFLGWVDAGPADAMIGWWRRSGLVGVAQAYLALDSLLFVPAYAACLLVLAQRLADALCDDGPAVFTRREAGLLAVLAVPVAALVLVDLVENTVGLVRTPGAGVWLAVPALAGSVLVLRRLQPRLGDAVRRPGRRAVVAAVSTALALLALGWFGDTCHPAPPLPEAPATWRLGCAAHGAKTELLTAVLVLHLLALLAWLFGFFLRGARHTDARAIDPDFARRRDERARLRAALGDMFVRSRYVFIALALLAVLTVGMDQGRDVVYAMAASPFVAGGGPGAMLLRSLGALASFLAAGVALWLFVFACWLWTRSVCQLRSVHLPSVDPQQPARLEDQVAKVWARVLAGVPVLIMVQLIAGVMRDSVQAAGSGAVPWQPPAFTLLAAGVAVLVFGIGFLYWRSGHPATAHYYDCDSWQDWAVLAGFSKDTPAGRLPHYSAMGRVTPVQLPLVMALGLLGCRCVDVFPPSWLGWEGDYLPTMTLGVILFALGLWLCFFGWLSMLERHRSIPFVLILVLAIGLLGAFSLTDNHRVWWPVAPAGHDPAGLLRMLGCSALLLALLIAGYAWVMAVVRRRSGEVEGDGLPWLRRGEVLAGVALLAGVAGVLALTDRYASSRPQALPTEVRAAGQRPTLDAALADWLGALCPAHALPCDAALAPDGALEVFFVSTEGGGVRAAAWTAFALHHLAEQDPQLLARTFSISGVSGGAVGAAVFRACDETGTDRAACLKRLAATDLLSPLLSAWLFEDALARVLPTSWCHTPGCGVMSRGAWFEQALEAGAPRLRAGLIASRPASAAPGAHRPYLLLNSTWVESGERAIGSDLRIDWRHFVDARDTLGLTGQDMALATAAHNAARFPFINAIGALQVPRALCLLRSGEPRPDAEPGKPVVCGHLADGGYFDNSGGNSTIDVLHGLQRCLGVNAGDADAADFVRCAALPAAQREWLRAHLVPRVLMVRNGTDPAAESREDCVDPAARERVTAAQVTPAAPRGCSALAPAYRPARPVCRSGFTAYVDLLGPALTAVNATGIGAAGQLAEARQADAVRRLRASLGGAAARSTSRAATVLDLLPDGVRYPLGWHLSALAVEGMWAQARSCSK